MSTMSIRRIASALAALLTLLQAGAQPELRLFEAVEPHMGTLVQVKLYARSTAQAQPAIRQAFDRIAALENILSDYQPESELNRVCRTASDHPVRVSGDLFHVLAASQRLAAQTGGAFDITVGPLTHLWRQARYSHRLPDAKALSDAYRHCGYRKLYLDAEGQTVKLAEPGMQLDVGAIGKGYAADEAMAVLRRYNIQSALVSVSGDLAFSHPPPGKSGWRIAIDSLAHTAAVQTKVLSLRDGSASTSGDAEQHLDLGTVRYSHIIDPRTGKALTQPMTVTLIATRGIDADSLATAVCVLGPDRGIDFIDRNTRAAALIAVKRNGVVESRESSRFKLLESRSAAE